jgi:hypothetical protein
MITRLKKGFGAGLSNPPLNKTADGMFNPWNHTQFGTANTSMTSANFGKITGLLVGARRMQFGLRLTF